MSGFEILIWSVATISTIAFVWYWVVPYITTQIALWTIKRAINKIAKKHKGTEVGDKLTDAAKQVSELMKENEL